MSVDLEELTIEQLRIAAGYWHEIADAVEEDAPDGVIADTARATYNHDQELQRVLAAAASERMARDA